MRDPRTAAIVAAWEGLTPATVPALLARYADDARFRDPFNDVRGHAAIARILDHMFRSLGSPRFMVTSAVTEGEDAFLIWDFSFHRTGGRPMSIHGVTHLRFAADGRVALHRDYWDAAEELYAKLPVIGAVMRWLRGKLATPA
nr:nuclear transport factor 2 family protein [Derxia gummosa]